MAELILPQRFKGRELRWTPSDTTLMSTTDSILEKESAHQKIRCRDNDSSHKSKEASISDEDATKSSKKKLRSAGSKILRMFSNSTSLKSSVVLLHDETDSLRKSKNIRKRIPNKGEKSAPVVFKRSVIVEGLSRVENKCPPTTKTYNTQADSKLYSSKRISSESCTDRNVSSSFQETIKRRRQAKTQGLLFNARNNDAANSNKIEIYKGANNSSDGPVTNMNHASMRATTTKPATASSSSLTNHGESSTDIETKEGTSRLDEAITAIDRASIRLDGIEVYAMVSALTIATSVSLFDLHRGQNTKWLDDLFQSGEYLSLITSVCVLCSSVSTILLGLHATLIFSLMTMYGRTAVGVGNDSGYSDFFQKTGHIRYRAFQSFRLSLYSFLVQVFLTMLEKVPVEFRLIFGSFLIFFCCSSVYNDTENIIRLASDILFKPLEMKK